MDKLNKKKFTAVVKEQRELAQGIYSLLLKAEEFKNGAVPGQFVMLYCRDGRRKLGRPLSICEADPQEETLRIVYRKAGAGTGEFSKLKEGECIQVFGPLGNGYDIHAEKVILTAGGIGIPPMLELAKHLTCEKAIVLGYKDSDTFLTEDFEKYGKVYISTDDGSLGIKGNVIDAIRHYGLEADTICACGPMPMLRGLNAYAEEKNIDAWFSLEEHMACGIGVCLGCAVPIRAEEGFEYKRVCKDGPVFNSKEIMFDEI